MRFLTDFLTDLLEGILDDCLAQAARVQESGAISGSLLCSYPLLNMRVGVWGWRRKRKNARD